MKENIYIPIGIWKNSILLSKESELKPQEIAPENPQNRFNEKRLRKPSACRMWSRGPSLPARACRFIKSLRKIIWQNLPEIKMHMFPYLLSLLLVMYTQQNWVHTIQLLKMTTNGHMNKYSPIYSCTGLLCYGESEWRTPTPKNTVGWLPWWASGCDFTFQPRVSGFDP